MANQFGQRLYDSIITISILDMIVRSSDGLNNVYKGARHS